MQCKPYVVEDISNGLEKQPVRAVNYWNHKEMKQFEYIATTEALDEINNFSDEVEYKCKDDGSHCSTKKYIDIQYEVYYVDPQKEWGVRPMSDIPGGSYLFEYAGELSIAKDQYENDDYIYSITSGKVEYVVDSSKRGNVGRFVNHSCEPNLFVERMFPDGCLHNTPCIVFRAKTDIPAGEELTVDYGDSYWHFKPSLICLCNSLNCRYNKAREEQELTENVVAQEGFAQKSLTGPKRFVAMKDSELDTERMPVFCATNSGGKNFAAKKGLSDDVKKGVNCAFAKKQGPVIFARKAGSQSFALKQGPVFYVRKERNQTFATKQGPIALTSRGFARKDSEVPHRPFARKNCQPTPFSFNVARKDADVGPSRGFARKNANVPICQGRFARKDANVVCRNFAVKDANVPHRGYAKKMALGEFN